MNPYRDISPYELLPVGTPVMVKDKCGKVTGAKMVMASNGGEICLHEVKFTHRVIKTNLGPTQKRINPPKIQNVNYSFIKAYV